MQRSKADPQQRQCECGALTNASNPRCRKCRARAGWYRRKAWRTPRSSNRTLTGRK